MHRISGDFSVIEVEYLRQNLEGKPGGNPVHPFVYSGIVAVLLHRLGLRIGIFQILAIVNPHLGEDIGVFRFFNPGQGGELREHFQRTRRTGCRSQRTVCEQFLVNFDLIRHPQTIRHLDDIDPIQKRLVILVIAERLPFRLIGVGQNDSLKWNGRQSLSAVVIAFLSRRQQWMQHFNRGLEHLDKFHQAAIGPAQRPGETVRIRVILGEMLQLADIHLADQRGNILVVFIARFGFSDRDLMQNSGPQFDDTELGNIAIKFL